MEDGINVQVDTRLKHGPHMTTMSISVTAPADFHVHLRQDELCALVTPHVRKGGFTLAYVMVTFQYCWDCHLNRLDSPI